MLSMKREMVIFYDNHFIDIMRSHYRRDLQRGLNCKGFLDQINSTTAVAKASASTSAMGCRSVVDDYSWVEKPRITLVAGGSTEPL
jgi:hypothetical protein